MPADDAFPGAVYCPATGKVRHPSRKVAVTNLNRVRRGMDGGGRDRRERGKLSVYRCPHCQGGYHIGNKSPDRGEAA